MIGSISGTILASRGTHLVIGTPSGVGYKIYACKETLSRLRVGHATNIWIHTIVRETAFDLYGFEHEHDLALFELLLTVSGIGPKSAMGILDMASTETLRSAISSGHAEHLTKMSGIGRKTAEKIVLELREKIGQMTDNIVMPQGDDEASEALKALGYSAQEARDALRKISNDINGGSARLREALKVLGSK